MHSWGGGGGGGGGAGLHGLNGVNPEVSLSLWKTYIRPRLLYGLESIKLSKSDLLELEKYQRDFLRRTQHLSERVAMCSVYFLSGPEVIKLFSCSTQLSMKFFLLINVKMPTIVGILTFMSGKNSILVLSEHKRSQLS